MGKTVLAVESEIRTLNIIAATLEEQGHQVVTAVDDAEGLRKAVQETPDLIILDLVLPGMDGESLARYIRAEPALANIPILMIITEDQLEELTIGPDSSANDYLIKPFDAGEITLKTMPYLGKVEDEEAEKKSVISCGNGELDNKMGGGIPVGSLTLIEGSSGAGKSVLSQQMMWGCLQDHFRLSLFTTENTVKSLVQQMRSLNLDILDYLLLGQFRAYPIEVAHLGRRAPTALLEAMHREAGRDMLFIDSLTTVIAHSSNEEVLSYFEQAKRLCSRGRTLVIILHSHALNPELLIRLRSLCDAHLQLRSEEVGKKLVKTLEVTKVRGADKTTGNIISFEVEPAWGMRVIPINRVKG